MRRAVLAVAEWRLASGSSRNPAVVADIALGRRRREPRWSIYAIPRRRDEFRVHLDGARTINAAVNSGSKVDMSA